MGTVNQWLLEQALQSLDDLFYAFSLEGEALFWNDRVPEVTGYAAKEIAEMEPTDFFPADHEHRIEASVQQAVDLGDSIVEADLLTKDGERIPYEFSGRPLADQAGELIGFTGVGRDISQRKARERKLREQTRQFQGVLDSVEAAIWIRDLDSRFKLLNQNARALLGIDIETDIEGRHPSKLLPKEIADQFVKNDQRAINREQSIEFEEPIETTVGTRTFLTRIKPLYEDGDLFATCGVATDITDLKRSQRELEQVNERLDEFVGIVSHDLRNPLNVASGRLELAKETGDSEHLRAIKSAHNRMEALIEDMLALARKGKPVSGMETVVLADMIEACWRVVETAEATLAVETGQTVRADASRLQQLLENLIRNAIVHGGRDVTITVGELKDGFFIADDGPGIPLGERDEVFKAGYTTSSSGTGLGLNIVEQIADAHDWTIRAVEGRNGGARFEIAGVDVSG